ncbi:60Kd inner membrane protein-domain-containing protein [Pavlovales sp. CCMP2436]|nr:60Kd inner membrane protein-domain-containing protein [Pavlovales sp. CCMP2436]
MSAELAQLFAHAHEALAAAQPLASAHAGLALSGLLADADMAAAVAAPAAGGGPMDKLADLVGFAITGIHDTLAAQGLPKPYGLSIILFTLLVKTLLFPLNYQQIKSTTQMQLIAPKVAAIRAKYPNTNDADKMNLMNNEIAQLYQTENLNPLQGCLPSIAQIPVFISLYRALINLAKADKLDEPFLWIPSLEGPVEQGGGIGWLTDWVDGHPAFGWSDTAAYLVLPVLLVACQAASFKVLTPPSTDPNTKRTQDILQFLPLMIGFFSLSTPSGLVVYWVINSVLTTLQTLGIRQLIGYKAPEPVVAGAGPVPDGTSFAPPSKGFGSFKSAQPVTLDSWPAAKTASAPSASPVVGLTPIADGAVARVVEGEGAAHVEGEHAAGDDSESKASSKRRAKAEAKAKGGFKGK